MLYFHINAFQGIEEEETNIRRLIGELGDIQNRRTVAIEYLQENRNDREKAIHRLVILGVIEDYTNEYAHNQINLRLSGINKDAIRLNYLNYIRAYDPRLAEVTEASVNSFMSLDHTPFVEALVHEILVFIYSTVELGRRRSLAEMLQACTSGRIRQDILNYLQLGAFSEYLASAMDRKEPLSLMLSKIAEQITSPNEAAELRGETARLLESYPNNPALLFIRSMAEYLCGERDAQIALDNLSAATQFSLSGSGWALSIEEVAAAVAQVAEVADQTSEGLGVQVVERYMSLVKEPRPAARAIIAKGGSEVSYRAADFLIVLLTDKIEEILDIGGQ